MTREQLTDTIVLVEDEPVIAMTTEFIVQSCGAVIRTATCLESGLALVQSVRPKLVLLDINLPDGSGVEMCAAIRQDFRISDAYILFISTDDADELMTMAREAGADGFLCKPFDPEVLLSLVRSVMETNEPRRAVASQCDAVASLSELRQLP